MRNDSLTARLVLACALLAAAASSRADPVVVVARGCPVDALTLDQVAAIFLGKADALPGGVRTVPYDLGEESALRQSFYQTITGKTPAQLKAYWSRIIFTGKGAPPRRLADAEAVRRAVGTTPCAIGYLDRSDLTADVKVVYAR